MSSPSSSRGHPTAELAKIRAVAQQLQRQSEEHIKMYMEMGRGIYGTRTRFAATEAIVEGNLAALAAHQDEVKRHLQQFESQVPMAGQVVQESFAKLASEIDIIKQSKGEIFTKQMCAELELMRQHVVAHKRQTLERAGTDSHHQMLIDNLGLAYAQLLAAMESSKALPDAADMPE